MSITHRYFDYNATCLPAPGVKEAVLKALEHTANPSSIHQPGQYAHKIIRDARQFLAETIQAEVQDCYFTGSGTEANALALLGVQAAHIVSSTIEHSSVYKTLKNLKPDNHTLVPVTSDGVIDLDKLEETLKSAPRPTLISIMLVNNETGAIQPIEKVVEIAKKYEAWVHTDAIQALGKIPVSFQDLGVDLMSLSGHKIGGPQGIGALIMKQGIPFTPLYFGGGQEKGLRPGTENLISIAGFHAALTAIDIPHYQKLKHLRDRLELKLSMQIDNLFVASKNVPRIANTSCLSLPNISQVIQLMSLDACGFALSAGSACSSGKVKPSHVLLAMGLSEEVAESAIRVSMGSLTTSEDVEALIEAWKNFYHRQHAA